MQIENTANFCASLLGYNFMEVNETGDSVI